MLITNAFAYSIIEWSIVSFRQTQYAYIPRTQCNLSSFAWLFNAVRWVVRGGIHLYLERSPIDDGGRFTH